MAMKGFATNPMVRYVPLCRKTPYSENGQIKSDNSFRTLFDGETGADKIFSGGLLA